MSSERYHRGSTPRRSLGDRSPETAMTTTDHTTDDRRTVPMIGPLPEPEGASQETVAEAVAEVANA